MTEEIKRIIDYLKRSDKNKFGFEQGKLIDYEEAQLLLDYITNLQQENERLKEIEKEHKNCTRKHWQQKCFEHSANEKIYKSRCEKAKEYIKEDMYVEPKELYGLVDGEHLLNILNGSDEK